MCMGKNKSITDTHKNDGMELKIINSTMSLETALYRASNPVILIVGAGVAGIACAIKLIEYGFDDVQILEAEDRIGGRINTIEFADNHVDLGAQWVHGEKGNAIFQMIGRLNLLDTTGDIYVKNDVIRSSGEVVDRDVIENLTNILNDLYTNSEDMVTFKGSLEAYIRSKYAEALEHEKFDFIDKELAEEFLVNFLKTETSETAVPLDEVSPQGYSQYWGCEGDYMLNWKDKGYIELLRYLMASEQTGKEYGVLDGHINLSTKVEKISWGNSDSVIEVACKGVLDPLRCDHVIVTVSLGVLKAYSGQLFVPPLPMEKYNSIQGLGFGSIMKIIMEFPHAFWPEEWSGLSLLWREEDKENLRSTSTEWLEDIIGFFRYNYQPRVLIAWVVGKRIKYVEDMTIANVQSDVIGLLRILLPQWEIPEPTNLLKTSWTKNENFQGAYSFRVIKSDFVSAHASALAQPLTLLSYAPNIDLNNIGNVDSHPLAIKPVVLFAGEATSEHFFSTVHGALETGWREANRLDGYYSRNTN